MRYACLPLLSDHAVTGERIAGRQRWHVAVPGAPFGGRMGRLQEGIDAQPGQCQAMMGSSLALKRAGRSGHPGRNRVILPEDACDGVQSDAELRRWERGLAGITAL